MIIPPKFEKIYYDLLKPARTTYTTKPRGRKGTLTLEKLTKLYKQTKNSGKYRGFESLYYRGFPIEIRDDVPTGVIYFVSNHKEFDEDTIWAMRCLANDIEGKRTWPWSRLVWRIKRWLQNVRTN